MAAYPFKKRERLAAFIFVHCCALFFLDVGRMYFLLLDVGREKKV